VEAQHQRVRRDGPPESDDTEVEGEQHDDGPDDVAPGQLRVASAGRRVSTVVSELRDSETTAKMMAHLNQALGGTLAGLVPEGTKVRFVLREEDQPETPRPIAGGSDAGDDVPQGCRGYEVGSSEMAPKPPIARRARPSRGARG